MPFYVTKNELVPFQGEIRECKKIFKKLYSGFKKRNFKLNYKYKLVIIQEKSSHELFRLSLIRQYTRHGASIFKFNSGNIYTFFLGIIYRMKAGWGEEI